MQNSESGALLWGLDLKHRSQIRKTATGLEQSEELPGRGRGSPFSAGTSLLSTTLKAGQNLSGSGLSTGPGRTGGQHIFIAHTHWKFSFLTRPISVDLLLSPFSLPSFPPNLLFFLLSFCPYIVSSLLTASRPLRRSLASPSHALRPWLTTTQCSTPLMTDVSDCCLLSERFYTYGLTST